MADQWIQSRIAEYLKDKIYSFIKEGPTKLVSSQCKYHYCISQLIWYKVRIAHTCVIILDQNHPLYWVIKNCGKSYLNHFTEKQLDYKEFNSIIYVLLFNRISSSNHLTLDGCKENLQCQKNQILTTIHHCNSKNLLNHFCNEYIRSSNNPLQIKQVNSYYSIQNYKKEIFDIIDNCEYFEGFILKRQIINHKGVEYEQSNLIICFFQYNERDLDIQQDSENQIQIRFSSKLKQKICNKEIVVNSFIKRNGENQSILTRKLISINKPTFLQLLVDEQYEQIFPNIEYFYKNFTQKIIHKVGIHFKKDDSQLPFQPGSVLRVDRGKYFHAGVYLKLDLVIHVKITKKIREVKYLILIDLINLFWIVKLLKKLSLILISLLQNRYLIEHQK
ncbi:hypothetical protein TTHERM_000295569 (macronuclear) [Tetrahymena thermophila SB210]|uniref:Uncharacterized protein n=1 Tax=Tetrahymena thermophila (strain SB210) TaxID=312017 RepID=W7XEJ3_TETTS|nr:hypothetical protein TTHERM_000295569 [Tetrahymena thermophila SB210]EWS75103.1 hypothetical protein TTHERM_000295569 [Tetrahymena thermophila SB210]|eukprot:XP_012652341.1 hypothetical protein TTHERM_000295569 [Tetrahymena thermophila SB210]